MSIEKLYQLTILDYAKRKDLQEEIKEPTDVYRGNNTSCGDDISLVLKIQDNVIKKASYIGKGCAISCASSAMLVELIKGKTVDEAKNLVNIFFAMLKSNASEEQIDMLNEAQILSILKDMPSRIKCATLSWHSLDCILKSIKIRRKKWVS